MDCLRSSCPPLDESAAHPILHGRTQVAEHPHESHGNSTECKFRQWYDLAIVLVADISGMPTVIQNMFALPDLRKSDYSMLLIYDKNMAKRLKEGQATDKVIVMHLQNGKVTKVEHADSPEALTRLLGA